MSKETKDKLGQAGPIIAAAGTVGAFAGMAAFPDATPAFMQLVERVGFPGLFLWLVLRQHGPILQDIRVELSGLNTSLRDLTKSMMHRMDRIEDRVERLESETTKPS